MTNALRGWWTAALAGSMVVLLPLTTFLFAAWLLGWQLQRVESGSMSPTFPVGALLVVQSVDPSDVQPGMAITFVDPDARERLVAHRVVRLVDEGGQAFVTRGDANATEDPRPVPARFVRGRVAWSVAALGEVLDWLQWPRSFLLLVVVPSALLVGLEIKARRARVSPVS